MESETLPSSGELAARVRELEAQVAANRKLLAEVIDQNVAYQDEVTNLQAALANSRFIGAAIGIVMATYKVTVDQAFETLRVTSQRTHRKLRDIAADIVLTGLLPPSD